MQRDIKLSLCEMIAELESKCPMALCQLLCIDVKYGRYQILSSTDQDWMDKSPIVLTMQGCIGKVVQTKEYCLTQKSDQDTWLGSSPFNQALLFPIIYQDTVPMILALYGKHASDIQEEVIEYTLTYVMRHHQYFIDQSLSLLHTEQPHAQEIKATGQVCVDGIILGQALFLKKKQSFDDIQMETISDPNQEIHALNTAVSHIKNDIDHLYHSLEKKGDEQQLNILKAYHMMIDHHGLQGEVSERICQEKISAKSALAQIIKAYKNTFDDLKDVYQQSRYADLLMLAERLFKVLCDQSTKRTYPDRTILIGENISAMDIAGIPEDQLVGLIDTQGTPHAHVIILARALGIVTLVQTKSLQALAHMEGRTLLVDGYNQAVIFQPSHASLIRYHQIKAHEIAQEKEEVRLKHQPAQSQDGHTISLLANVGLGSDFMHALKEGSDGIGLFRTEIPFMARDHFPGVQAQATIYGQALKSFHPKPVIIRTLDVGGDKQLPYFQRKEKNPYLGWRGIRVMLDHPTLLKQQFEAILKASIGLNNARILLPMISHVEQMIQAKSILRQVYDHLDEKPDELPMLGMMIEVPSVLYQMKAYAEHADFFSVGSNDLLQYLSAVDRNNPKVSSLYNKHHPALLSALEDAVQKAHAEKKHISICGELAACPQMAMLLVAMGFDALSMSSMRLSKVKWMLGQWTLVEMKELLSQVRHKNTAAEVTQCMHAWFDMAYKRKENQ